MGGRNKFKHRSLCCAQATGQADRLPDRDNSAGDHIQNCSPAEGHWRKEIENVTHFRKISSEVSGGNRDLTRALRLLMIITAQPACFSHRAGQPSANDPAIVRNGIRAHGACGVVLKPDLQESPLRRFRIVRPFSLDPAFPVSTNLLPRFHCSFEKPFPRRKTNGDRHQARPSGMPRTED